MSSLFLSLYYFFKQRKWLLISVFFSLIIFFVFTATKIKPVENIMQMLPGQAESGKLTSFLENSKFSDRIMLVVSDVDTAKPSDPDNLIELSTTLIDSLNTLNKYIEAINYKTDESNINELLDIIHNNLPIFLDDVDYKKIDSVTTETGIKEKVQSNYNSLITPEGIAMKQFIAKDPLGLNFIVLKKLESLKGESGFELHNQHYLAGKKHHLLVFITPKYSSGKTAQNIEFFKQLDRVIESSINKEKINVHYFGAPVVAAGNSAQIHKDTNLTIIITIVVLVLIFLLFFRKLSAPILILVPVVFGGLFAVTVIYFLKGSISIISLGAGSLVLGIAVNYSLHFLTYQKYHPGIVDSIKELSFPMIAGSLTTIGGFLCLQFVDAPVLQDIGLYAALSLTGAAIATLVFLPHFVKEPASSETTASSTTTINLFVDKITGNKKLALVFLVLTPVFFYFAREIKFETDMYKINYMSDELKQSEKLVNQFGSYFQKSIFTISSGKTLDEAVTKSENSIPLIQQYKEDGKITAYSDISILLPSEKTQINRIRKWNRYWNKDKKFELVHNNLIKEGSVFKFKPKVFDSFLSITEKKYTTLSPEAVTGIRTLLLNNFIEESKGEFHVIGIVHTHPDYANLISDALTKYNPELFIFDRQQITDKLVNIVSSDFNFITLWTSLLVLFALLIIYGRIELAIISFIPMVLSWIWILGIMAIFDIKFNIINIVLSTLIFALGDDFCIFTTDSLQNKYTKNSPSLKSTTTSITLSAITTIIGMGVLIFAGHPALNSIALVSIIGIFSVWLMSQVFQPVLFHFLISNPTKHHHEPYTFFNILKSIFAFSYFIIGSLLISGIGFVMFKIFPAKSNRKKYLYHVILSRFAWSMIYIMGNVKKRIINDVKENFSKPAVIIANHSSFLDILLMVMLHPKLILLTNNWVWNSPIFGLAVRLAEYYPVAEGAENTIGKLSDKVAEGYSIVVFPEGTRSVDGKIGRFHKGAFYLAENLNVDILPIVVHGANYTMTKGFFYLKNGQLTLQFLPRIKPGDQNFGSTYSEKAKFVGRYFREQHKLLSTQIETPGYYKKQLFNNYIFKGPVLEWYMRVKVRLENNYEIFNKLVPKHGNIVDIGCGYGFLSYMLSFTSKERIISGIDYDSEKIEVAENGFLKDKNLSFTHANALEYEFKNVDTFILNDVLHYLNPNSQLKLIDKCIQNLNPGGQIILRDGVSELSNRHKGTKLTEFFSTKVFNFNKTENYGLNFISNRMIREICSRSGLKLTEIDNTKFTSNIIFVLKK